jgi:hypothetical protein
MLFQFYGGLNQEQERRGSLMISQMSDAKNDHDIQGDQRRVISFLIRRGVEVSNWEVMPGNSEKKLGLEGP